MTALRRALSVALVVVTLIAAACTSDPATSSAQPELGDDQASTDEGATAGRSVGEGGEVTPSADSESATDTVTTSAVADSTTDSAASVDDAQAAASSPDTTAAPEVVVEDEAVVNEPAVEVDDAAAPDGVESIAVPDIGATAWAVVIAGASDPFDPLLGETVDLVAAAGHTTTITNCDVGAAEALGMQPAVSYTISVYAADEDAADRLAASLETVGLPGVVTEVSVVCP